MSLMRMAGNQERRHAKQNIFRLGMEYMQRPRLRLNRFQLHKGIRLLYCSNNGPSLLLCMKKEVKVYSGVHVWSKIQVGNNCMWLLLCSRYIVPLHTFRIPFEQERLQNIPHGTRDTDVTEVL